MSMEQVMGAVARLAASTDALAAVGARITLADSGQEVDPRLSAALDRVCAKAEITGLDDLPPPQRAVVAGMVRLFLRQAEDLAAEPGRAPGWVHRDPVVLEGIGRASAMMPGMIVGGAPELASATSILDVGTGVGWFAIAAATVWPSSQVVGIDVWEPSLERARRHVAEEGLEDRITLRNQDIAAVDDANAYDVAWLPSFFIAEEKMPAALDGVLRALRPGGTAVVARFGHPAETLAAATASLKTLRDGGCELTEEAAAGLLRTAGYARVGTLPTPPGFPGSFLMGRKTE